MSPSATLRKPLGIRATPEEHERITQAAQREHRSVNSFVLHAALQAAKAQPQPKPKPRFHPKTIKFLFTE